MLSLYLDHLGVFLEKESTGVYFLREKHSNKPVRRFFGSLKTIKDRVLKKAIFFSQNKNTYYKTHTKLRFLQRYNVKLSHKDYRMLCQLVKKEKLSVYLRNCHGRYIYAVLFRDRWFPVVYDPEKKIIVTVLKEKEFRRSKFFLNPNEMLLEYK